MIYSMTGFAAVTEECALGTLAVDIRSVNHRYLDVQLRLPEDMRAFEPALRELLANRMSRGKVECRLSFARAPAADVAMQLNAGLLEELARIEQAVQAKLPSSTGLSVAEVLRWPGMLETGALQVEQLRDRCVALVARAAEEFAQSRAREGTKLRDLLLERIGRIEQIVAEVRPRIPQLVAAYQERLAQRLREAMADIDEERVRQELVLFASKVDVDEELARLGTHVSEARRILAGAGAAGKRLDFLMQELNREANTLGSKSVDAEVSQAAMELKVLIEQMREQVQNIE